MTLPTISPQNNFTCFSCSQEVVRPFSKIFRGHMIYHVCSSKCLPVALQRLGLICGDDRSFTSPVNISVQSPTSAFVNTSRSPIHRSIGSPNLNAITLPIIPEVSEEEEEPAKYSPDMDFKQLNELGKRRKLQ